MIKKPKANFTMVCPYRGPKSSWELCSFPTSRLPGVGFECKAK